MPSEMESKYHEKKNFKKDIVLISNQLKISLSVFLYNAFFNQVNIAVRSRYKVISTRNQKKNKNLTENQKKSYEKKKHI